MAETWDMLEDWEDWTPESGTSFRVHALAGSLAGGAEHCAIFPIDTIKTHMQTHGSGADAVREIVRREGPMRLWRGVSTMLTACIPAHAAYFSLFEHSKVWLGADQDGHHPLAAAGAGVIATVAHDVIMTPMDVLKQRLQLGLHTGVLDCARTVVRTEGVGALFLSFPTTLVMNIPYASVMVASNESIKKVINPSNEYNLPAFFLSGGISGAIAAALTNPLDVAKTRLQTQSVLLASAEAPAGGMAAGAGGCCRDGAGGSGSGGSGSGGSGSGVRPKGAMQYGGLGRSMSSAFAQGRAVIGSALSPLEAGRGMRHMGQPALFYSRACCGLRHGGGARSRVPLLTQHNHCVKGTTTTTTVSSARSAFRTATATAAASVEGVGAAPGSGLGSGLGSGVPLGAKGLATAAAGRRELRYKGLLDAMRVIYAEDGAKGFAKGLRPRLLVHAPSVAISWSTYETAKDLLTKYM